MHQYQIDAYCGSCERKRFFICMDCKKHHQQIKNRRTVKTAEGGTYEEE